MRQNMADAALQQKSPLANQPRDSSSLPTQAPADDDSFVSARIRPHHQWLQQSGKLLEASGVLTAEKYVLALHTDFGPLDQDKTTNQDYALAWQPSRTPVPPVPSLIVALADGLTSSFRSEWASALVCSVAARSLAELASGISATAEVGSRGCRCSERSARAGSRTRA